MITDVDKYILDSSNNVYKIIDSHYLKLSPTEKGNKYFKEIDNGPYHVISYNNACMVINTQYNALPESWKYEGTEYFADVLALTDKDDIEVHTINIRLLPDHSIAIDKTGPSMLKLIRSKGKMYYILLINEKLPRVKAYDLFGNFCQWLGIQNCKPVWNQTEQHYM